MNTCLRVLTCLLVWSPQPKHRGVVERGKGEMECIEGSATSAQSFIYSCLILYSAFVSPLTTPMTGVSLYLMLFLLKSEPPKKVLPQILYVFSIIY